MLQLQSTMLQTQQVLYLVHSSLCIIQKRKCTKKLLVHRHHQRKIFTFPLRDVTNFKFLRGFELCAEENINLLFFPFILSDF